MEQKKTKTEYILVTGGTGYIGSHTVVELQEAGKEVIILDNLENSSEFIVDQIEKITNKRPIFEKCDVMDPDTLFKIFEKYNVVGIIHFAAKKSVEESTKEPIEYYLANTGGLINIVTAMRKFDVKNIVFSSSCTVYGQPEVLPVTEKTPRQEAESPYGNTKKICEDILKDATNAYEINAIALRYFNPIGAHPSARIGELPHNEPKNIVPIITQVAAKKRDKLLIFGDDYNTKDGTCVRDFIYVQDLAKAHIKALEKLTQTKGYDFYNVGSGSGYTVLELIKAFEQATGIKIPYDLTNRRPGDIEKIYADTTKAKEELHFEPQAKLTDMLKSAWEWEQHVKNILNK
jgi:UDP-glucose 4-epimerase